MPFTLPEFTTAQAVGLIAYAVVLYAFSRKDDKQFIIGQIVSSVFWVFHYGLMGKLAASAVTAVHVIRYGSAPFARANPKFQWLIAITVSLLYLSCGLFFAHESIDWMPIIASCIGSFVVALLSGIRMRMVFLLVSCCWLSFNLISGSIGGVLTDISVLTINAFTIWRMHRDHQTSLKEKAEYIDPPA